LKALIFQEKTAKHTTQTTVYIANIKETEQMKEIVKEINELCKEYLGFVESAGNECAYTDSIIEKIISKANELKTKYDEEV
jgi:proline dehydrogenase